MPAEEVRELYRLADYFMDIALQTAITNTVGSVPANIPNIAEVLTKAENSKEVDISVAATMTTARDSECKLNKMKNVGRRKGRPPKKSHWIVENNSAISETVKQTTEPTTRIKRKSAVEATEKWKAESTMDDDDGRCFCLIAKLDFKIGGFVSISSKYFRPAVSNRHSFNNLVMPFSAVDDLKCK